MSDNMAKIYGIDLGTTYSCISYVDEHGKPVIIPNAENQRVTPSVVFFDEGNVVVGKVAKENAALYPTDVAAFVKRSMGDPNFLFENGGKEYRPEEISSYIIKKLVNDAEQNTGEKITDVVITCPAYFGVNEREATRLAGEIAGLNVRQIINEPTAAAVHYGETEAGQEKVVLVYDLGGGTFDITMIAIKPEAIEVICTGGDHNLGGKDWDDTIVQYLVQQFQEETGTDEDILEDADTWQDLQLRSENAKQTLSQRGKAPLPVAHGGERVKVELTREKFTEITQHLIEKTISLTHDMLEEGRKKGYDSFDEILLVGGSTRMPRVAERVSEEFGKEPRLFDPDESVAKGAALFGMKLLLNDELVSRIAVSTGKSVEEVQSAAPEDIPEEIREEAERQVADNMGFTLAAVKRAGVSIKNVTSKSFGVVAMDENKNEITVNLILKNTTVPAEVTERFGTHEANQDSVEIRIMENEVSDATLPPEQAVEIGVAELHIPAGLPPQSPIDITFELNEEGRLEMTAVEKTESRTVDITVETASIIQGEELERAKERSQQMVVS